MAIYKHELECGLPIAGYYRYKNMFQICEADPVNADFDTDLLSLEFDSCANPDIEGESDRWEHMDFLKELTAILSLLTNCRMTYSERDVQCMAESIDTFSDQASNCCIRKDPARIYAQFNCGDDYVSIQDSSDEFLDNYFKLKGEDRVRVKMSLMLYYNSKKIWMQAPSLAFIGFISTIENLAEYEFKKNGGTDKKCSECGQLRYRVCYKFNEFMKDNLADHFEKYPKKLINDFYAKRSKISHAGALMSLDYINSHTNMSEYNDLAMLMSLIRVALYNYVI
jgi:hypothetical protein